MKHITGSVSSGTMNPDHLIPRFMDALRGLDPQKAEELDEALMDTPRTERDEFLEALFDLLGEYAPPYFYFGAHEGDGSDYGFWLCSEALEDFDGLRVRDLAEVPAGHCGEVLLVNDHGNATLYAVVDGEAEEVWSVA